MLPPGDISGSSLGDLYTSSLKKPLIDFLFLWSISSHGNLKADPVRKNDVFHPSKLRSRARRANYVNPRWYIVYHNPFFSPDYSINKNRSAVVSFSIIAFSRIPI